MPIPYTVVRRYNPLNPTAPLKYYAQAKASRELSFREICKSLADGSTTVSDTDLLASLNDLSKLLRRGLDLGKIVRLNGIGSFQIVIGSTGAETEEAFKSSLIKNPRIVFRPDPDLKDMLSTLKYVRVK